jgi:lipoprotein NlpI
MHQVDLALADYGAVLAMPEAPAEQKAKALVNRGVVYGRTGKPELELADYGAVLAMPEAPAEQKAGALVNRGVVYGRTGKPELALADYGAVLAMPEAPAEQKAGALGNLGWLHYQAGRFAEFAAASRDSLTLDPSSTTNRANLGLALLHLAKPEEARAEYTTVLAQITSADELEEKVLTDLREALSREPDLQGARLVLNLAEERRRALAAPTPSS